MSDQIMPKDAYLYAELTPAQKIAGDTGAERGDVQQARKLQLCPICFCTENLPSHDRRKNCRRGETAMSESELVLLLRDGARFVKREFESIMTQAADEIERLQSKIDALMMEHCPDEMSAAQTVRWADSQRASQARAQQSLPVPNATAWHNMELCADRLLEAAIWVRGESEHSNTARDMEDAARWIKKMRPQQSAPAVPAESPAQMVRPDDPEFEEWFSENHILFKGNTLVSDIQIAYRAGQASTIPAGYWLAPNEPTLAMFCSADETVTHLRALYTAMRDAYLKESGK
jgi:hypothetical protein